MNNFEEVQYVFHLLGDSTRLNIINYLMSGEKSVKQICIELDMNKSRISHQLKVLKDHNLVSSQKNGRNVIYRLKDQCVIDVIKILDSHVSGGEHCEQNNKY